MIALIKIIFNVIKEKMLRANYLVAEYRYNLTYIRKSIKKVKSLGDFQRIELLGEGKDSVSFIVEREGEDTKVIKVLSDYGRKYLPLTKVFLERTRGFEEVLDVEVRDDKFFIYKYQDLKPVESTVDFLNALIHVCNFENKLTEKGIVNWDFGVSHYNYLKDGDSIKWVDYGGNGVLFISENETVLIDNDRESLIYANNEFIQLSFLIHIVIMGVGQSPYKVYGTMIQDDKSRFGHVKDIMIDALTATSFQPILDAVLRSDLTTSMGWETVKNAIVQVLELDSHPVLEEAEIECVRLEDDEVVVNGYQNYRISGAVLTPLDAGPDWANSNAKWKKIDKAISQLNFKSYLDIGSNLGLYVFTVNLKYHTQSSGVDYNNDYVNACRGIASHLDLNCSFKEEGFSDISGTFDLVSFFAIIHHIYHRTESHGQFESILGQLYKLSNKYVLIEFPTENDLKAKKWTTIPAKRILEDYSLKNFLNCANTLFSKVTKCCNITKDRPLYLLEK